jgi:hypothetical protein
MRYIEFGSMYTQEYIRWVLFIFIFIHVWDKYLFALQIFHYMCCHLIGTIIVTRVVELFVVICMIVLYDCTIYLRLSCVAEQAFLASLIPNSLPSFSHMEKVPLLSERSSTCVYRMIQAACHPVNNFSQSRPLGQCTHYRYAVRLTWMMPTRWPGRFGLAAAACSCWIVSPSLWLWRAAVFLLAKHRSRWTRDAPGATWAFLVLGIETSSIVCWAHLFQVDDRLTRTSPFFCKERECYIKSW